MIFSYLSHKKMSLNGYGMQIIATSSPIAYQDITQSFQNEKQMILISDDEYNNFGIAKECLSEMAKDNPERFRKEFMGGIPNDYLSIFDNIYNHIDG